MPATSKGRAWEWLQSFWILFTFTLGLFNWIGFFYIGIRTRQRKWILWGLFYSIPFALAMAFAQTAAWDGWFGSLVAFLLLLTGLGSIIHAFIIRKEYLLRLEALERTQAAALQERIAADYGLPAGNDAQQGNLAPRGEDSAATLAQPGSEALSGVQEPAPAPTAVRSTVDINNDPEQALATLPGIGLVLAKKAIRAREARGGYASVEDFGESLGLKPHMVERIRPLVQIKPMKKVGETGSGGRVVDI